MVDIAKRRLPNPVIMLFVYISYCAAEWYAMRGSLAYYGEMMDWPAWFVNDAWAFFLGGLLPLALYAAISAACTRSLTVRLCGNGDFSAVRYGLSFAVISANVLLSLLKLIFFAAPMYASMLNILFDPIITIGVVSLYMWYAFRMEYVKKCVFRIVLMQVMGAFVGVYALLTVLSLLVAVFA